MTQPLPLSLTMREVQRRPFGRHVKASTVMLGHNRLDAVLTEAELHLSFMDCDGPAFAVDLDQIKQAMADQVGLLMGIKRKVKA